MRTTNKKMSKQDNSYWLAVAQDKKGPSTRSSARREEVSNGANLSSSASGAKAIPEDRQGKPPGLDEAGPGSQPPSCSEGEKRNRRGFRTQRWHTEHKKVLLHCYHYSRYEKWSRSSGEILAERVRDSDLPEDKKNIDVPRLRSIISQMGKYLTSEEMTTIKNKALRSAEEDYRTMQEEENRRRQENKWEREERWVLIWAMEYAKQKYTRQKQITESWRKIFFHFCPTKSNIPPRRLTTQRHNFLRKSSAAELDYMRSQVAALVASENSPLDNPVIVPTIEQTQQYQTTPPPAQPNQQLRPRPASPGSPSPPSSPSSSSSPSAPSSPSATSSSPGSPPQPDLPPPAETPPPPPEPPPPSPGPPPPPPTLPEPDDEQLAVEEQLSNLIEQVRTMRLEDRPQLSKLQAYGNTKALIGKVNIALKRLTPTAISLTELNQVRYAAGLFVNMPST